MSTFAGIDWGGAHHQVAVVDDDGRELWNRKFAHDRDGLDDLIDSLAGVAGLVGVAIERSEGIVVERLQHHRVAVFPVSPRVSARARERYQAAARKNDRFDAFVSPTPCAPMVGDGARSLSRPSSTPSYARLSGIDASAVNLSSSSSLNFATRCSHITPGVVALFSRVDRDATLAFLRDYPTAEAAGRVGVARMAGFCHRIGYSGRVPTDVLVGRLRAMLLTASPGSVNGHRFAALALADQLSLLNQQVRQFNRRIDELLAQHPDTPVFASFPAAGRIATGSRTSRCFSPRPGLRP